jgi:hypothetical protein
MMAIFSLKVCGSQTTPRVIGQNCRATDGMDDGVWPYHCLHFGFSKSNQIAKWLLAARRIVAGG